MLVICAAQEFYCGFSYMFFEEFCLAKSSEQNKPIVFNEFAKDRLFRNKPEMIEMLKNNWDKLVII